MSEFNLDREMNIRNNIDAQGKKWVVHIKRGSNLCFARPEPDRADAHIPDLLAGHWTKVGMLNEKIKMYVTESWDKADELAKRAARKAQAAKELEEKERADEKDRQERAKAFAEQSSGQEDAGSDSIDEVALTDNAKPAKKGKGKT